MHENSERTTHPRQLKRVISQRVGPTRRVTDQCKDSVSSTELHMSSMSLSHCCTSHSGTRAAGSLSQDPALSAIKHSVSTREENCNVFYFKSQRWVLLVTLAHPCMFLGTKTRNNSKTTPSELELQSSLSQTCQRMIPKFKHSDYRAERSRNLSSKTSDNAKVW